MEIKFKLEEVERILEDHVRGIVGADKEIKAQSSYYGGDFTIDITTMPENSGAAHPGAV